MPAPLTFTAHDLTDVIQTPHHAILIDSRIGNDKTLPHVADWHRRHGPGYERALGAAGLRYQDIDYVF